MAGGMSGRMCVLASYRGEVSFDTNSDNSTTDLAGRLAEIIVLDQFSRNLCRGQASAFTQDNMALVLAQSHSSA